MSSRFNSVFGTCDGSGIRFVNFVGTRTLPPHECILFWHHIAIHWNVLTDWLTRINTFRLSTRLLYEAMHMYPENSIGTWVLFGSVNIRYDIYLPIYIYDHGCRQTFSKGWGKYQTCAKANSGKLLENEFWTNSELMTLSKVRPKYYDEIRIEDDPGARE